MSLSFPEIKAKVLQGILPADWAILHYNLSGVEAQVIQGVKTCSHELISETRRFCKLLPGYVDRWVCESCGKAWDYDIREVKHGSR